MNEQTKNGYTTGAPWIWRTTNDATSKERMRAKDDGILRAMTCVGEIEQKVEKIMGWRRRRCGLPEPREKVSSPDVLNKETSLNTYPQVLDSPLFIYSSRSHPFSELHIEGFHPSDNYKSSILVACLWWGMPLHVSPEFYYENIFKSQKTDHGNF